jgi:cation diffusion facilitator CzcD-associated flavoprotein CzcO
MAGIRARYEEIFARCRETWGCFVHAADQRNAMEVSADEREAFYEGLYNLPGFAFWQGNFRDSLMDQAANDAMTAFITRKIRGRVKDQKVADRLIPTNHGFGTRRVPLESGYYEVFNQPNVELVDLRETPIERITANGIRTSDRERAFDMIIFATGFDAITGAFDRIDIQGRDGQRLRDKWADGPHTYLGLNVAGFPNMLTLVGPHNAATFCNLPRCIEQNVEWVSDLLRYMREKGLTRLEATASAEEAWTAHVHETGARLLLMKVDSWMTGVNKNVPGRQKRTFMAYAGGAPKYRQKCDEVAALGYDGFALS